MPNSEESTSNDNAIPALGVGPLRGHTAPIPISDLVSTAYSGNSARAFFEVSVTYSPPFIPIDLTEGSYRGSTSSDTYEEFCEELIRDKVSKLRSDISEFEEEHKLDYLNEPEKRKLDTDL